MFFFGHLNISHPKTSVLDSTLSLVLNTTTTQCEVDGNNSSQDRRTDLTLC